MIKGLGRWELPQPLDIKDETEWIPIPRIARTIPFGYMQDEQDPDLLQPVQQELDKLEMARDYLKQITPSPFQLDDFDSQPEEQEESAASEENQRQPLPNLRKEWLDWWYADRTAHRGR